MSSSNPSEILGPATNSESVVDQEFEEGSGEDTEEEYEEAEEDDEDESGSVSSFSESELPDRHFDPMPEHLTLPLELQRLVLSLESSQFQLSWGDYRLVCKAWKEYVELLARTRWIRTAAFGYAGYMTRDEGGNKVMLNGFFSFKSMEGEMAVFRDEDCAEKHRKSLIKACKTTAPPDVEVCGFVHDVEIPGMSVDWDALTITCPWRALVGRVIAEELRVAAYRRTQSKSMFQKVKGLRNKGMDGFEAALMLFGQHFQDGYVAVRRQRLGYMDKRGDERLKDRRFVASFTSLEDDDEEEE